MAITSRYSVRDSIYVCSSSSLRAFTSLYHPLASVVLPINNEYLALLSLAIWLTSIALILATCVWSVSFSFIMACAIRTISKSASHSQTILSSFICFLSIFCICLFTVAGLIQAIVANSAWVAVGARKTALVTLASFLFTSALFAIGVCGYILLVVVYSIDVIIASVVERLFSFCQLSTVATATSHTTILDLLFLFSCLS